MNSLKAIGAMLGAAYGDALGWPNIRYAEGAKNNPPELVDWTRSTGGRIHFHTESIKAGEYSDYFRLTLSVARSIAAGGDWFDRFAYMELPLWSLYERGEIGASRKAADSWLEGSPPWHADRKPRITKHYFESDGDGAVRRILPHVAAAGEGEFKETAAKILSNAIVTHGHPRALLGALAYGYALWRAFRQETTLSYGQLVDELINTSDVWAAPPGPGVLPNAWHDQAKTFLPNFQEIWSSVKSEILQRLEIAKGELNQGSLCVDSEALGRIKRLDARLGGSGVMAAVSALFLASRHASAPNEGVGVAASIPGVDTATLASMTGALLGALYGTGWLDPVRGKIESAIYIERLAKAITEPSSEDAAPPLKHVTRESQDAWRMEVANLPEGAETSLPDGRSAVVRVGSQSIGGRGAFKLDFRLLELEGGETIHLKTLIKGDFRSEVEFNPDAAPRRPAEPQNRRFEPQRRESPNSRRPTRPQRALCGQKILSESLRGPCGFTGTGWGSRSSAKPRPSSSSSKAWWWCPKATPTTSRSFFRSKTSSSSRPPGLESATSRSRPTAWR